MTKIGVKLILGFGMFIVILIAHSVLVQLTTIQASETHERLTSEITPAVALLSDFKTKNKELFLLVANKVVDRQNVATSKRIDKIVAIDLPDFVSKMKALKKSLAPTDIRYQKIEATNEYAMQSIKCIENINFILNNPKDYEDEAKVARTKDILDNRLTELSENLNDAISFLTSDYNRELENNVLELSSSLTANSRFVLITSALFIAFGLLVTFRNIKAIVKPINVLMNGVQDIQKGNYEKRISLRGNDEFVMLGEAFNQMSDSLKTTFAQIKTKNKELEQFVYIASHDLQEPLRTLNSFTDLLVKDYNSKFDDRGKTYLRYIAEASSRMRLLVKCLLDYSLIGNNKSLSMIDCNALFNTLEADFSDLIAKENALLEVGNLPTVLGYRTELKLLFWNLIDNALKFQRPNDQPVIKVESKEHAEYWEFLISDNGIGIKETKQEKIFGMFHRLNAKKQFLGTGIGLAHCMKVVEMHGGTITVDSDIGKGSTFYVTISKNLDAPTAESNYLN